MKTKVEKKICPEKFDHWKKIDRLKENSLFSIIFNTFCSNKQYRLDFAEFCECLCVSSLFATTKNVENDIDTKIKC